MNRGAGARMFVVAIAVSILAGAIFALERRSPDAPASPSTGTGERVEILLSSSEDKAGWIGEVTADFNARRFVVNGRTAVVKVVHERPSVSIKQILGGTLPATIWSPPSDGWLKWIEGRHRREQPEKGGLLGASRELARSAAVIAVWEPMARALGWPERAIGWEEILSLAGKREGWASRGHPEWGRFSFGQPRPDHWTAGTYGTIGLLHAAAGKSSGLTLEDTQTPESVAAMRTLQRSVSLYAEDPEWLIETMCRHGPRFLSAVPLDEAGVIRANERCAAGRLVAIYPKEGVIWKRHPAAVLNAEWVTADQRAAAQRFLEFALSGEEQAKAPAHGLRPVVAEGPPSRPFDPEHGLASVVAAPAVEPPGGWIFGRVNWEWHDVKKRATTWILLDNSNHVDEATLERLKRATRHVLERRWPDDLVRVLSYGGEVRALGEAGPLQEVRGALDAEIANVRPGGASLLRDALAQALREMERARSREEASRVHALVVIGGDRDDRSRASAEDVLALLPEPIDQEGIRVFAVLPAGSGDSRILRALAQRSGGRVLEAGADDLLQQAHSIAGHF